VRSRSSRGSCARLTPEEWTRRSSLCDADSPRFLLDAPDYYCLYPISVVVARR
jgi:hypothetical protein